MGLPSYQADIQDRALDNQIAFGVVANGSAGAAGAGKPLRPNKATFEAMRAKRKEAQARMIEERTKRLVDDALAWREAIRDVIPLRKS